MQNYYKNLNQPLKEELAGININKGKTIQNNNTRAKPILTLLNCSKFSGSK